MAYATRKDVPPSQVSALEGIVNQWVALTGFQFAVGDQQLVQLANQNALSVQDVGQWAANSPHDSTGQRLLDSVPWAQYGLDKMTYQQMATTFNTSFSKITGQAITPDQLTKAFQSANQLGGGLLSAGQYEQQLMNDSAIQSTYGWVKYGMQYAQWQQQKLSTQTAMGRPIHDSEASTILQYDVASKGANMSAVGRAAGQQAQPPAATGVAGSMAR